MSFLNSLGDFFLGPEIKSASNISSRPSVASPEDIEAAVREAADGSATLMTSAVYACARVIAENLAKPPLYLVKEDANGKTFAKDHPLFNILNASPNDRQTSYEFREQVGFHKALNGNAFAWLNRGFRDAIEEILPLDPGMVSVNVDTTRIGGEITYRVNGRLIPNNQIWHLKGPSWLSYEGMDTLVQARNAIGLARATETYGSNLFKNGARPGGLLVPNGNMTDDQKDELRDSWNAQASGVKNAHKTILLPSDVNYQPLGSNANDAQWIEARRFQIEEVCRFFRVSPTKVFQALGSQSYASVEQAHIAHDQDTDAHWHERFVQSANKNLLTDAERAQGYRFMIDNRDFLRGTAKERMEYYQLGISNGIITRNEAREMEGFSKSNDPEADTLTPAANLFGDKPDAKLLD